jgi:hypothetical protein
VADLAERRWRERAAAVWAAVVGPGPGVAERLAALAPALRAFVLTQCSVCRDLSVAVLPLHPQT